MNKLKIGLITILGICLLYFTSLIFNYNTSPKKIVSSIGKDNHTAIQGNNNLFSNNSTSSLLTKTKSKTIYKEKEDNYNKEILYD
jgi:hypothetical protein